MDITNLILKSLEYYDNINKKYAIYLEKTSLLIFNDKVYIKDINYNDILISDFEILGIFDEKEQIFIWSWLLPYLKAENIYITQDLIKYALNLESDTNVNEHFFIKSLLLNSRQLIESSFNLELLLSIVSYLSKNKFSFIYPYVQYLNEEKTKKIIVFYLIKNF
jgi:hypothetical protein